MDYMFIADGAKIPFERFIVRASRSKLAFVLGKPLQGTGGRTGGRVARHRIRGPGDRDHRCAGGRIRAKIFDTVSDNGAAAGIVMGGRPVGPMDVDLRWVSGLLSRNAEIEETGVAAGVLGHPAMASPGSPTRSEASARRLSRGTWCLPVPSPVRCGRRKAIPCARLRPLGRNLVQFV